MTVSIEFLGAARTVTGSRHLLRTDSGAILLDCGLFQGRRGEALERNRNLGVEADEIDAVVLSHAHIDHSGALPLLVRRGYRGPIYTTPATRDLCAAMLVDAAMIQASDARHVNRLIARGHHELTPVEPLYDQDDVAQTLTQMSALRYHHRQQVLPGVNVTFNDAGHVLGSAIVVLDIADGDRAVRLCFTGDLGRAGMPILRDPEPPTGVDMLVMESTYGDRRHRPITETRVELRDAIRRTRARGGKVIIPAFALERAQEVILALKTLMTGKQIPSLPIYVDSPLTTNVTDVFRRHPECYDDETRALIDEDSPFDFPQLRYVADADESRALDASDEPCVIISASGMCESGRVLHHLRAAVGREQDTVCIVGFQAQHTLGRRLVEQRPRVRIFGIEHDRRCEIVVLNGFSAHADQQDLVDFVAAVGGGDTLSSVALVHGEPAAQNTLRALLLARGVASVSTPERGERITVSAAGRRQAPQESPSSATRQG